MKPPSLKLASLTLLGLLLAAASPAQPAVYLETGRSNTAPPATVDVWHVGGCHAGPLSEVRLGPTRSACGAPAFQCPPNATPPLPVACTLPEASDGVVLFGCGPGFAPGPRVDFDVTYGHASQPRIRIASGESTATTPPDHPPPPPPYEETLPPADNMLVTRTFSRQFCGPGIYPLQFTIVDASTVPSFYGSAPYPPTPLRGVVGEGETENGTLTIVQLRPNDLTEWSVTLDMDGGGSWTTQCIW